MNQTISPSDEQFLLKELSKGNHQAYERLFHSFYVDLCRFGIRYVRDENVAEEIVQEVFIYLWHKRTSINISVSFKSYLYTAVRNKSINYLKLQLPKDQAKEDIDYHDIAGTADTEEEIVYKELEEKIAQAIDKLPKKCRIIFDLSRNAGLTYKEISSELDISVKTVENQMVIALRKLRASLDPFLND